MLAARDAADKFADCPPLGLNVLAAEQSELPIGMTKVMPRYNTFATLAFSDRRGG